MILEENKPRLVNTNTGSGFSVFTVEYKNKFLYSKYNPSRAILSLIERMEILPNTLILINSPCLFYGLRELIEKCPKGCTLLAIEDDLQLFDLAKDSLESIKTQNPLTDFSNLFLFSTKDLAALDLFLRNLANKGQTRRAIPLDFSAGKSLNPKIYDLIFNASQDIISTFWKNRITLVKMGRLFSKNIFKNLKSLAKEKNLSSLSKTVGKPIVVFGAGESLDFTIEKNDSEFSKALYGGLFFVIAVDASFTTLLDRGIKVDAVVGLESQFAIQKAYIGSDGNGSLFFADLCSRPQVQRLFSGKTIFFISQFAQLNFLERLKSNLIIEDFIPPLGSVGLGAVYIALNLRQNDSVPIFISGLDFSYSIGKTHANFTPAHKQRLCSCNRFDSVENFDAAFSTASTIVIGKDGKNMVTSPIMLSYRQNFVNNFANQKNLFDMGKTGIDLGLQKIKESQISSTLFENKKIISENPTKKENNVASFLRQEREELLKLRDILSKGQSSDFFNPDFSMNQQVENLLQGKEYLYLHFPDGYALSTDTAFLKRVRAEIDFFLKFI